MAANTLPDVPLALEHHAPIEAALAPLRARFGSECLSELAFSNLYLFRHAHAYRYQPGRWPCVSGVAYDGVRHLLPLFDPREAPATVLHGLLERYDCFFPVHESTLPRLMSAGFSVTANPDDADYLYQADDFRNYSGPLLRKKRQLMQQLLAAHRIEAHALTPDRVADAISLLRGWMTDKDKGPGEADESACREALGLMSNFDFDGRIYYAGGIPAGFVIAQSLNDSVSAMRFAKGSDAYKGIYQYMFHHYCVSVPKLAWMNFEQDLGLPNFRQTKRSYQPARMLTKFRLTRA